MDGFSGQEILDQFRLGTVFVAHYIYEFSQKIFFYITQVEDCQMNSLKIYLIRKCIRGIVFNLIK